MKPSIWLRTRAGAYLNLDRVVLLRDLDGVVYAETDDAVLHHLSTEHKTASDLLDALAYEDI